MDWKNLDKTKSVKYTLIALCAVAFIVSIFEAGVYVGYRKAVFNFRGGEKFYRAIGERQMPMMPFADKDDMPNSFGASGKIVSANLPKLIISDRDGTEKTVVVNESTIIKKLRSDASSTELKAGDFAIIIGSPNDDSAEITAKLIRILPPPPQEATSTK